MAAPPTAMAVNRGARRGDPTGAGRRYTHHGAAGVAQAGDGAGGGRLTVNSDRFLARAAALQATAVALTRRKQEGVVRLGAGH